MPYPRKPTAIRRAEGVRGHHRPLNTREPKVDIGEPDCPKHLTGEARREWKRVAPMLAKIKVLSVADRSALAGYCETWARWIQLDREIKRRGLVVSTKFGPKANPAYSLWLRTGTQLRHFAGEFGLTPASRTRIEIDAPMNNARAGDDIDEFARLKVVHGA